MLAKEETSARVNASLRGESVERRPLADSRELAEYLGVPPRTLDQWAYKGIGPTYRKVGRHRRYKWADVDAWLDQQAGAAA